MLGHVLLVRRAHPRSRGEHYHKQAKQMRDRDSSPLARGTRSPAAPLHRNARLIPARAGNTYTPGVTVNAHSAHPRSRGEHNPSLTLIGAVIGSSPLARGTPAARSVSKPQLRLIPARAGNTDCSDWLSPRAPAHPRSRGEHSGAITSPSAMVGSSPLAQGTQLVCHVYEVDTRLIPARTGNTRKSGSVLARRWAHPRSRREHTIRWTWWITGKGSSPLARGTHAGPVPQVAHARFIPARAGNTGGMSEYLSSGAAHPRSRGEHLPDSHTLWLRPGSSPLARGTPLLRSLRNHVGRLIPARAGNMLSSFL